MNGMQHTFEAVGRGSSNTALPVQDQRQQLQAIVPHQLILTGTPHTGTTAAHQKVPRVL